jgi:hypothetical protein
VNHRDHRPRDVAGGIRGEEAGDGADFPRLAEAAQRDHLEVLRPRLARVGLGEALGLDAAGGDRIDRDLLRPDLPRKCVGPSDDARPDGVRQREVVDRLAHRARLDVDHAPAAAPLQLGQAEAGQADGGEQQQFDSRLDLVVSEP